MEQVPEQVPGAGSRASCGGAGAGDSRGNPELSEQVLGQVLERWAVSLRCCHIVMLVGWSGHAVALT